MDKNDNQKFICENGQHIYQGDSTLGEIEVINTNLIFKNKFVYVSNDGVRFPAGNEGTYLRVSYPYKGSVGVLPITKEGKMVLIKTFRHAVRAWGYEVPKGGVAFSETYEDAASRETLEETGYCYTEMNYVGEYSDSPAVCQGLMRCYIAENCTPTNKGMYEETEAISGTVEVTPEEYFEIVNNLESNYFRDALTEMMVYKYLSIRNKF